jgi:hypothetical protein
MGIIATDMTGDPAWDCVPHRRATRAYAATSRKT